MILQGNDYHARQFGCGRTNSGPSGKQTKPGRALARERGRQQVAARHAWCWILYATPANVHPGIFKKVSDEVSS